MILRIFLLFVLTFGLSQIVTAQEILISKDINTKNYYAYDIVGKVNDRIILYKDQGLKKEMDVFDMSMNHKFKAELILEDKKALVHLLVEHDSVFHMIYSYSEKDSVVTSLRSYNERIELVDSTLLFKREKVEIKSKMKYILSEDRNKLVLHHSDREKNLLVNLIDLRKKENEWEQRFAIKDIDIIADFLVSTLSDKGQFVIVYDKKKPNTKKDKFVSQLFIAENGLADLIDLNFDENIATDMILEVDNINDRIFIGGLYSKKGDHRVDGLYFLNKELNSLSGREDMRFMPFSESFVNDVASKRKGNKKQLENFSLNNLVFRNDGGVLLFAEMNRIYNRRNPYNGVFPSSRDNYGRRGWTDYYNEDVIIMSMDNTGEIDWKTILYKKQFSQDDDGIYSSYFIYKTPSRIRMLYNDEIKKSNTVSEYMIDPLGNQIRNSLLSTEYQNLKLRFTGAIQVASNMIIVPSETSYNMNLVKIEY